MDGVKPDQRSDFATNLGRRLRAARGERSQAEFARELGVATNSLARYERGEVMPSAEFLTNVVRLTGADPLIVMGLKQAELKEITREAFRQNPVLRTPDIAESGRDFETEAPLPDVQNPSGKVADAGSTALPDRETLKGCIAALEETERYRRLPAEAKARAIVALYEVVKLTDGDPRQALKGSAA